MNILQAIHVALLALQVAAELFTLTFLKHLD
jgi:hypothetical protein